MANLDMEFQINGSISSDQKVADVKHAVKSLPGVNHVKISAGTDHVIVGYTPGLVTIQEIKETIESQGLDVSDRGDS